MDSRSKEPLGLFFKHYDMVIWLVAQNAKCEFWDRFARAIKITRSGCRTYIPTRRMSPKRSHSSTSHTLILLQKVTIS